MQHARQTQELEWTHLVEQTRLQERLLEYEWKRREEEQERRGLRWDAPLAVKCSAYGVREYRSRLLNIVPYRYNWQDHCEEIPLTLHGQSLKTSRCENESGVSRFEIQPQLH